LFAKQNSVQKKERAILYRFLIITRKHLFLNDLLFGTVLAYTYW